MPAKATNLNFRDKIDNAVVFIGTHYDAAAKSTVLAVGEYLFTNFYDGDESLFRSRSKHNSPSLSAVSAGLKEQGVRLGASALWSYVCLYLQGKEMASSPAYKKLTYMHQYSLLTLTSTQAKRRMARLAVQNDWHYKELQQAIRREYPVQKRRSRGRGRPVLPDLVKISRQMERTRGTSRITLKMLKTVNDEQLDEIEVQLEELEKWAASGLERIATVRQRRSS